MSTLLPTVVAVPARLQSSRLPNKVLADIGGQPMLQRVLDNCRRAKTPVAVVLCTDSEDLAALARSWGFKALLTDAKCDSGSARIASVAEVLIEQAGGASPNSLIINVQGDQPFVDPAVIDAMALEFSARSPIPEILTPVYRLSAEKLHNPNVVKTLLASDGQALYFSRSALPHVRDIPPEEWHLHASYWGHVGIYGFRADVLMRWDQLPLSPLEQCEKLEQLRLIEAGIRIGTFCVEGESLSVDTPEQLEEARGLAAETPAPLVL